MDLVAGTPVWVVRNGPGPTWPPLARSARCAVAVIGGGITGAAAADALAAAGLDVMVLDRREIGTGSTAASTGLLQYDLDTTLTDLARRVGEAAAVRCYRLCAEAVERIAVLARRFPGGCGHRRRQGLCGATRPRDVPGLRAEYELQRRHGFAVAWWDRRRVAAESTLPFHAAIVTRPAAEIDAHRLARHLLEAAAQRGARIHARTTVLRYAATRRGVVLHTAEGPVVRARRLVIAAGYEADAFLGLRATDLLTTFAIASEPLDRFPGWPGRRLIWETARPYHYLRTTADGRAIIGGGDVPFVPAAAQAALLPEKSRQLRRQFRRWFPEIRFTTACAWSGTFATTRDGLPFIGAHPDYAHAWFALGYGGNGILFAVIAAGIIRDLCRGRPAADAALFRFGR